MTHTLDGANAVLRGIKRRNPTLIMVQAIILGIIINVAFAAAFAAVFLDAEC